MVKAHRTTTGCIPLAPPRNGTNWVALLAGGPSDIYRELRDRSRTFNMELAHHWSAERKLDFEGAIPRDVDLVIVLKDFIGHPAYYSVRDRAKARGIRIVVTQRKWSIFRSAVFYNLGILISRSSPLAPPIDAPPPPRLLPALPMPDPEPELARPIDAPPPPIETLVLEPAPPIIRRKRRATVTTDQARGEAMVALEKFRSLMRAAGIKSVLATATELQLQYVDDGEQS